MIWSNLHLPASYHKKKLGGVGNCALKTIFLCEILEIYLHKYPQSLSSPSSHIEGSSRSSNSVYLPRPLSRVATCLYARTWCYGATDVVKGRMKEEKDKCWEGGGGDGGLWHPTALTSQQEHDGCRARDAEGAAVRVSNGSETSDGSTAPAALPKLHRDVPSWDWWEMSASS